MKNFAKNDKGFSLVELSIVLIIIGLLVAGVTGGSKLINSAQLNKFSTDLNRINAAYTAFIQIYDAKPGDFKEAASFWSGENNGDGDGKIEAVIGVLATAATGDETSNAFRHLALAELFDGSFNPQIDQLSYAYKTSLNSHAALVYTNDSAGAVHGGFQTNTVAKNVILVGSSYANATRAVLNPGVHSGFLSPQDAASIDKKLDDGLPETGVITVRDESAASTTGDVDEGATQCFTAASDSYNRTLSTKECNLVYKLSDL